MVEINAQNISFSGGDSTSVFLCTNGLVYLSGANSSGELGNSTTTSSNNPVLPSGINGTGIFPPCSQVCYRDNSSCMVLTLTGDTVLTWGKNTYGQLGDGITAVGNGAYSNNPKMVVGINGIGYLKNIGQISGGIGNSYALTKDGKVLAWGKNSSGENGDGTNVQQTSPVYVVTATDTLRNVKSISGGGHFCLALLTDGTVWGWGGNNAGQLAQNNFTNQNIAVQIKNSTGNGHLSKIIKIAAREDHALALSAEDTLWAWGNNSYGQLGINNTISQALPKPVSNPMNTGPIKGVTNISAGGGHNFAVLHDSTLYAWGNNSFGQLGTNNTVNSLIPKQVLDVSGLNQFSHITKIAAGHDYSMAVNDSNKIYVWGNNTSGQLATGNNNSHLLPYNIPFPCTIKYASPISLGICSGTPVECAGNNSGSINLSGNSGNVVAWQLSNDNFVNYIAKASTSSSFPYSNLALTTYFRPVIEANYNIYYTSGYVTYVDAPSYGNLPPSLSECRGNNSGTISLSSHSGNIIRWESSPDNFMTTPNYISNTSNSLNYSNLSQNTYFRVMLKNGVCNSNYSNTCMISISDSSKGGELKQDMTVVKNDNNEILSLSGYNGTIKQWESSIDNFASKLIINNSFPTLPLTNIATTTSFRVLVKSGTCPEQYSNNILIRTVETADTIKIKAYPTISPNNDLINDEWIIDRIDYFPNNEIKIYNRWGSLVYSEKGYDNKNKVWKGQANAEMTIGEKDLPEGTYFYNITLGNGTAHSGYVVLNR